MIIIYGFTFNSLFIARILLALSIEWLNIFGDIKSVSIIYILKKKIKRTFQKEREVLRENIWKLEEFFFILNIHLLRLSFLTYFPRSKWESALSPISTTVNLYLSFVKLFVFLPVFYLFLIKVLLLLCSNIFWIWEYWSICYSGLRPILWLLLLLMLMSLFNLLRCCT